MDHQFASYFFGLFFGVQEKGSLEFTVEYKLVARICQGEKYMKIYKGYYNFTNGMIGCCMTLFGVAWNVFLDKDSLYFIN